jgi:phosphoribosyl 1,2-cyclic phosphodiesterase
MTYTTPDNSNFATLKQAMQWANDTEQTEIALTHLNKSEIIYQLHPMSERLERVQTVREAKIKLNKI